MEKPKDTVIRVTSDNHDTTLTLNWDCTGTQFVRAFADIMHIETYPTTVIISCLREIADELEEDAKLVVEND